MEELKIDIGCGPHKRSGYLGIDAAAWPGVDYVMDIEREDIPLPARSASHIFSSHCLEHLRDPMRFFAEIGRLARDGAEAEIWTPYAYSNGAYMFSHLNFLTEDHYAHMCILFPEEYYQLTHSYWTWREVTYVLLPHTVVEIDRAGVPLDFALRYYKNVALEFGVKLRVHRERQPRADPVRYFSIERNGARHRLAAQAPVSETQIQAAIAKHARGREDASLSP